jgi:hypothetical protein
MEPKLPLFFVVVFVSHSSRKLRFISKQELFAFKYPYHFKLRNDWYSCSFVFHTKKKFCEEPILRYDTDRIENDASANSSLPRERLHQVVTYNDKGYIDRPIGTRPTFLYCSAYSLPQERFYRVVA